MFIGSTYKQLLLHTKIKTSTLNKYCSPVALKKPENASSEFMITIIKFSVNPSQKSEQA